MYCPKCGRLFKSEEKMLEHLNKEHVSDKIHIKQLIIEIDARYLGGHPAFPCVTRGNLSLYSYPQNKIVFKSDMFTFEIPVGKIRSAVAPTEKDKIFIMEFEDESGAIQTVVFDNSDYMTEFANELLNLRVSMKASEEAATMENMSDTVIKVRCPYCKFTHDKRLDKCPHCGAMNP